MFKDKKSFWQKVSIVLLILFLFSPFSIGEKEEIDDNNDYDFEEKLIVHFIDVGQGDAILIQNKKNNKNMLIDGGDRYNRVAEKLTSYLEEQEIDTIHAVVSTHPHADHIGGLTSVIKNFAVERIYDSGRVHTTQTYENYLILINEKDIPFYTPRRGDEIKLGDLIFEVLHPEGNVEDYSLNNASIVLRLDYKQVSFLFTGDVEYEAEIEILATDKELQSQILKVGHHGSRTSTNEEFLKEIIPEIAVIQAGEDNRYGHPHTEVLDLLDEYGVEIFSNNVHGDVVIKTDGITYQVETDREGDPRAPPVKININTADSNQLQQLTGIGPVTAGNIIEYREENDGFQYLEEIKEVTGIGEGTFENIKDKITVSDEDCQEKTTVPLPEKSR